MARIWPPELDNLGLVNEGHGLLAPDNMAKPSFYHIAVACEIPYNVSTCQTKSFAMLLWLKFTETAATWQNLGFTMLLWPSNLPYHANMANPGFTMLLWQAPSCPHANMANAGFYHVAMTPPAQTSNSLQLPDAPKTRQDCPRHPKIPQRHHQDLSKARF